MPCCVHQSSCTIVFNYISLNISYDRNNHILCFHVFPQCRSPGNFPPRVTFWIQRGEVNRARRFVVKNDSLRRHTVSYEHYIPSINGISTCTHSDIFHFEFKKIITCFAHPLQHIFTRLFTFLQRSIPCYFLFITY